MYHQQYSGVLSWQSHLKITNAVLLSNQYWLNIGFRVFLHRSVNIAVANTERWRWQYWENCCFIGLYSLVRYLLSCHNVGCMFVIYTERMIWNKHKIVCLTTVLPMLVLQWRRRRVCYQHLDQSKTNIVNRILWCQCTSNIRDANMSPNKLTQNANTKNNAPRVWYIILFGLETTDKERISHLRSPQDK